ncbi:MAG: hypothetical protein H7336_13025 [Bacteriovorax sp.]|nr:hypothetical protein [Bacteriovorax sp.]
MKKIIFLTFILSISAHAVNSRSPAVLDGTCNTNVPTTITTLVNGKELVTERAVSDILKDQCKAVKICMYSANDEDMDELKSLEAVACNNNMSAVTTKTPGQVVDKNFDGKRKAKFDPREQPSTPPQTITPTAISK